jgi:regulation of enolase protein 1 (concanavalin A-like superfamily)
LLSARVAVDFNSDFDAGVLRIHENDQLWAKLCFEFSPQRQPMVVSVVTRGLSDDCNSADIAGQVVYLRMAVTPQAIAFHYSLDGAFWHFVRYFTLGKLNAPRVGFSSQSPTGPGCRSVFSEIRYRPGTLSSNRSGE